MDDVAIGAAAKGRLAKMALEDGLAMLFFGLYSLIEGGIALIGAAFFGIAKARSKFVVPRRGFVTPKRPRWTCLGVAPVIVAAWGYQWQVSYQSVTAVLGVAVTLACLLQFRSYLNANPRPEPEHA